MKLCSACLLGIKCRYDGKCTPNKKVLDIASKEILIPVCPEQLGGLPTPRVAAEQRDEKVVTKNGDEIASFTQRYFDQNTIKINCKDWHLIICSKNDKYIKFHKFEELANLLNIQPKIIENGNHFETEDGYEIFEKLLEKTVGTQQCCVPTPVDPQDFAPSKGVLDQNRAMAKHTWQTISNTYRLLKILG